MPTKEFLKKNGGIKVNDPVPEGAGFSYSKKRADSSYQEMSRQLLLKITQRCA